MNETIRRPVTLSPITIAPAISVGEFQYFTVEDIAKAFGVKKYHIINLVREEHLHGQRIGRQYVIDANEFQEFIKRGYFEKQPYNKSGDEDDEEEDDNDDEQEEKLTSAIS